MSLRDRFGAVSPIRAAMVVLFVALAVRAWCLWAVPLIITDDGVYYLHWAMAFAGGEHAEFPPYRTPGYPYFLAALFFVFGEGPGAVLVAQHLLGALACAALAYVIARVSRPVWGVALGVLASLDPAPLAFESYALTESLSLALLVGAVLMATVMPARPFWRAVALGLVMGALCLVRPAFQIAAPFLVLGPWLVLWRKGQRARTLAWWPALFLAGFLAVTSGWIATNARRGITGLSGCNSVFLWMGLSQTGVLDTDHAVPDSFRRSYERLVRPEPRNSTRLVQFAASTGALQDPGAAAVLGEWSIASIREHPARYARAVLVGLGWQLAAFSRADATLDDTRWFIARCAGDGRATLARAPNFQFDREPRNLDRFAMGPPHPSAKVFSAWASWRGESGLRIGLFALTMAATVGAWRQGHPALAVALLGTLAYTAVHALFVLSSGRYSLPCWFVWYISPAVVLTGVLNRFRPHGGGPETRPA